jgi:hypothetical protein
MTDRLPLSQKCTVCDEEECICAQLPPHVKTMLVHQQHPHIQYLHGFYVWIWAFSAVIVYIAAWQAGYSPWWMLKNVLIALEVWHD